MADGHRIFYSKECDAAAERLGGYQRIDRSLDAILDALARDPTGFPIVEMLPLSRARYIVTKPSGDVPALVWLFVIEPDGDVMIEHVEEFEGY